MRIPGFGSNKIVQKRVSIRLVAGYHRSLFPFRSFLPLPAIPAIFDRIRI